MSVFSPRLDPIVAPDGTQQAALPPATLLLRDLVFVPPGANAARIQGIGRTSFAYRMDGLDGLPPTECLVANQVEARNRQQLESIVVASNGGATEVIVQFFTGSAGL